MARRSDGRVEPGQSLKTAFSARAWNRAQDAADIVLKTTGGIRGGPLPSSEVSYSWVLAKNTGTQVINRHAAVALGLVIEPSDSANALAQFQRNPVYTTAAFVPGNGYFNIPAQTTFSLPEWYVAVEPIAPGRFGRVAVSGFVQTKLHVRSSQDQYVTLSDSSLDDVLTTAPIGEAKVVWRGGGASFAGSLDDQWAIIELGRQYHTTEISFVIESGGAWSRGAYRTVQVASGLDVQAFNPWSTVRGAPPGRSGLIVFSGYRFVLVQADFWFEPLYP